MSQGNTFVVETAWFWQFVYLAYEKGLEAGRQERLVLEAGR